MIVPLARGPLHTRFGEFTEYLFYDGQSESIAIVKGEISAQDDVLCRVHSSCTSAHVFNGIECDCREQMSMAQEKIEKCGNGIIVWLDQDGKGNGRMAELLTARHRAEGVPQTEAYAQLGFRRDARSFDRAAEILRFFEVGSIALMSNNPEKASGLRDCGVSVSTTVNLAVVSDNPYLRKTYRDKIEHQNHSIVL
ncbi:GTP cyclohydrolase [Halostreptopolyspora alba]|uniref:GTP cyclohydrolase n=1 Tax=Halostreptopolyspora alba TaxID=2487137 RepID=A0A3N0E302_9ACTN|nr:GTP cyclohydrolase [Nocardiopsaceae bacterium YIM 96095]